MKRKAFTLIELLVVIAIIALLVSILLPSLEKAKDLARTVVCSSNMRNIGMQMMMYLEDSEQKLPPAYCASTGEYVAKNLNNFFDGEMFDPKNGNHLWKCPTDKYTENYFWLSYRPNYTFFRYCSSPWYYQYDNIDRPAEKLGFIEAQTTRPDPETGDRQGWSLYMLPNEAYSPSRGVDEVHNGNKVANYLWMDWHVSTLAEIPDPTEENSVWKE